MAAGGGDIAVGARRGNDAHRLMVSVLAALIEQVQPSLKQIESVVGREGLASRRGSLRRHRWAWRYHAPSRQSRRRAEGLRRRSWHCAPWSIPRQPGSTRF